VIVRMTVSKKLAKFIPSKSGHGGWGMYWLLWSTTIIFAIYLDYQFANIRKELIDLTIAIRELNEVD